MNEVDTEETGREQITSLVERITFLEKENGGDEQRIQELEGQSARLARTAQENVEKQAAIERAFIEIAQHVQGQATFNESTQRSIACLESQVKINQDNFHEVVRILQVHEQHIVNTGAVTQGLFSERHRALQRQREESDVDRGMDEREPGTSQRPPAARNWSTSPCWNDQGHDEPLATAAAISANRHRLRTNGDRN